MGEETKMATTLDPQILRRLKRLGAGIRLRLFLRGLGWVVMALLAGCAASFALDYGLYRLSLQHLSVLQRMVINGTCLAGVAAIGWRRLLLPLAKSFSVTDLALLVERANPDLQDRLISAMQFEDAARRPVGNVSEELMDAVIEQANESARPLPFGSVLRSDAARRALGRALACIAVVAALGVWQRELVLPWLLRTVLLSNATYPRRTALVVEGGNPLQVVRGGALSVTVRADTDRVVPEAVTWHTRFPSLGDLLETVKPVPGDSARFVKVFPSVTEPFSFFVSGNDDRTERVMVELVEPPALSDVRFIIVAPFYTLRPPAKVHATEGTLNVPEGSRVELIGRATKDLASAALYIDDAPAGECRVVPDDDGGAPRNIRGELRINAPEPFHPRLNMRIALRDMQGFENAAAAAFHVLLVRDAPPTIQLDELGMGGQISSRARIPLVVTATDDYGVEELQLEWSLQSMPYRIQRNDVKLYTPPAPQPPPLEGVFDLQSIQARATSNTPPLAVGETVRIQMSARDSLPANVGTNRVMSNMITFRIVTDDEVLSGLVDSQRVMREQLRQVLALQVEVQDRTQTAIDNSLKETTRGLARHEVVKCADAEQQVKDQLGATTERLEVLLDRIRNNRIVAETDERRMQKSVISTLEDAQKDYVTPLLDGFEAARKLQDADQLAEQLQGLVQMQKDLVKLFEQVLAEMIRMESAQQVERGLRTIIKLSDKVRGMMRESTGGDGRDLEKER